jgi:hypothetical protein
MLNMKRILNFYKQPVGIAIFVLIAIMVTTYFIYGSKYGGIYGNYGIEGLATGQVKPVSIADADPDLKCSGLSVTPPEPVKCEIKDMMKLAYDVASEPRLSGPEFDAISKVCDARKFKGFEKFFFDVLALRAATMYNTTANEKTFKEILAPPKDDKRGQCYNNDFMKGVKGLLVGAKDEPTLTVSQSEVIRCYAHRFNAFRKCMKACA